MQTLATKRVYDPAEPSDGFRVLVDRLWPRGLSKAKAGLDLWAKEIAPSDALRRGFHHRPEKFAEFKRLYRFELKANPALDAFRAAIKGKRKVTLLFGAREPELNNAVVLAQYLKQTKPRKKAARKRG